MIVTFSVKSRPYFSSSPKPNPVLFPPAQDGEVSVEEFTKGIEKSCKGNPYASFPQGFKFFIDSSFRTIDVDGESFFLCRKDRP